MTGSTFPCLSRQMALCNQKLYIFLLSDEIHNGNPWESVISRSLGFPVTSYEER